MIVIFSNIINPSRTSAMPTKIHQTVISTFLQNEFTTIPEKLIVEESNLTINNFFVPDKYSDELLALKKEEELNSAEEILPIDSLFFNEEHDLMLKPSPGDYQDGSGEIQFLPTRKEIIYYTVKPGDTVSTIARSFGVTVNTVLWANNLGAYSLLKIGDKLAIPPQSGLMYTVKKGDTLAKIAQTYKIDINRIIESNSLGDSLSVGQQSFSQGLKK